MIHTIPRRTRLYRQYVTPQGYRAPVYHTTSKALGPIMNVEKNEMDNARKEKKGNQS